MPLTRHQLALEIPQVASPCSIEIRDASLYAEGLGAECLRLDVTLPDSVQPIYITKGLEPGFTYQFSSIDLDCENVSKADTLPDGAYKICFSVSPNEKVNVCYYHMRMACLRDRYMKALCRLIDACDDPERDKLFEQFTIVQRLMDTAQAKAESCLAPGEAMFAYREASKLLDKLSNNCPTC